LLDTLLVVMLAVEADADANARVIFHALAPFVFRLVVRLLRTIRLSLDDQPPPPGGDELLKHGGKFFAYLLKGPLNGLVLALIEDLDQFLDTRLAVVELGASFGKCVPLVREVVVLLKRLLVHMSVLLQRLVDFV